MAAWFGPKTIGYGVSPCSWQGWVATAALLASIIGLSFLRLERYGLPPWTRSALVGVLVAAYLLLTWLKYDRGGQR